jgi:hypothetical protein
MKHLKSYKIYEASIVDRKMDLIYELTQDIRDLGLKVEIEEGTSGTERRGSGLPGYIKSNQILCKISSYGLDYKIWESGKYADEIEYLTKMFKSFGLNPRSMSSGPKEISYYFDKWGKMTKIDDWDEILGYKTNEMNSFQEESIRWYGDDFFEKSQEDISNVKDILIELEDIDYKIKVDYTAITYINKIRNTRMNPAIYISIENNNDDDFYGNLGERR